VERAHLIEDAIEGLRTGAQDGKEYYERVSISYVVGEHHPVFKPYAAKYKTRFT